MRAQIIGDICNYHGGLAVKAEGGKFFWGLEDCDTHNGYSWDEIPESLYRALVQYEFERSQPTIKPKTGDHMSTTIHKYTLQITDRQQVTMPKGAVMLCVQVQSGRLCLWAQVDPDEKRQEHREIVIYGTGHPMPDCPGDYIGTGQVSGFVWHVYAA